MGRIKPLITFIFFMTFHTEHVNYVNGAFFPLNFCWTAIFVSSSVAAETIPGREGVRPSSAVILNEDYSVCQDNDLACKALRQDNDRPGFDALKLIHRQIDDDHNGNVDLSESDVSFDQGHRVVQRNTFLEVPQSPRTPFARCIRKSKSAPQDFEDDLWMDDDTDTDGGEAQHEANCDPAQEAATAVGSEGKLCDAQYPAFPELFVDNVAGLVVRNTFIDVAAEKPRTLAHSKTEGEMCACHAPPPGDAGHDMADGVDEEATDSGLCAPVALWRRITLPENIGLSSGAARRWARLLGKVLLQRSHLVPYDHDDVPTSIGSVAHAAGKPCRPCSFFVKGRGCYDGVLCKHCHFTCDHKVDQTYSRNKSSRQRRLRRARREAESRAA